MDSVQVIFLSDSYKHLTKEQQDKTIDIIKSAFNSVFGTNSVEVSLVNGISGTNPNDIVLGVKRDRTVINEADFRTRFAEAVSSAMKSQNILDGIVFNGNVGWKDGLLKSGNTPRAQGSQNNSFGKNEETSLDYEKRALMYKAVDPEYTFESLCIPDDTKGQIFNALDRIAYEREVFDGWGLRVIMPNPVCALSFFGPAGTGKSLAADAIANYMGKKIIRTSYADIENKYVGEGPKNVCAVFLAAETQDAVLLIDEADSLLSKRLVNVQEASGQAINSMRSQLLISLEHFHGIVIFTTNMVVNYDAAFVSRLINVEFKKPDKEMRINIWKKHILPRTNGKYTLSIPLSDNIDFDHLASTYELSGRDIRNATVDACLMAYRSEAKMLTTDFLMKAAKGIADRCVAALTASDHTKISLSETDKSIIAKELQKKIDSRDKKEQNKDDIK